MNKKTKRRISLVVGILLLLVSLVLFILPIYGEHVLKEHSRHLSQQIASDVSADTLQANLNNPTSFDFSQVQSISVTSTLSMNRNTKVNYDQMIGQIVIPSVNINLTMFNGTNNENLLAGAATMKPNQVMGQGNFTLASHITRSKDVLFTNLRSIQKGAVVRITDKKTIYEYTIYETKTVSAYDVYLIEDAEATKHGKPILSLMSCSDIDNLDNRFFAVGELTNSYPYTAQAMEKSN